jgi:hypothetical protein
MNNRHLVIRIVLNGYDDSIFVNGMWYMGSMPAHADALTDVEIAGILTYLRSELNDSTVVSCNSDLFDDNGFAICQKTPRTVAQRSVDSVAAWEVKIRRDSLAAANPIL